MKMDFQHYPIIKRSMKDRERERERILRDGGGRVVDNSRWVFNCQLN